MRHRLPLACALLCSLILGACGSLQRPDGHHGSGLDDSDWALASTLPAAPPGSGWQHQRIGQRKPTEYATVNHAGRPALQAISQGGDSLVRHALGTEGAVAGRLAFSWFLEQHNRVADVSNPQADDAPLRVMLQFDGDRSRCSAREQRLSDLLQALTGWSPATDVGTGVQRFVDWYRAYAKTRPAVPPGETPDVAAHAGTFTGPV